MKSLTVFDGGNTKPPRERSAIAKLFHSDLTVKRTFHGSNHRVYAVVIRGWKI